jgi:hypothetical protein
MDAKVLKDRVVVILAAGCAAGRSLALMAARVGGQVIVVDHDEAAVRTIAQCAPDRIEALRLDPLHPAQCRLFHEAWGDESLDLLICCHPLRAPHRLGAAAMAIPAVVQGLAGGLARGRGQVVMLHRAAGETDGAGQRALVQAFEALPGYMQSEPWAKSLRISALRLPATGASRGVRPMVCALMASDPPFAPGLVLPLVADPIDAGRGGDKPTRDE